ncbi:MAG: hypothetical protein M2R45_04300 [Verrucomicrobia subdivision 3 bacterium]|nr:hypothetical protein [Limisphaerales bacterium]MCS1417215.1 hypothetical protein [Limisphaerales bacterium]
MKGSDLAVRHLGLLGLLIGLLVGLRWDVVAASLEDLERPQIVSIRLDREDLLVEVNVPKGYRRITLESRTRLGRGSWVPRRVQRFEGNGGTFTFRLKREAALEILRVSGTDQELLPASFYKGPRFFAGPAYQPVNALPGDPISALVPPVPEVRNGDTEAPARNVVESDIWQIDGDRMYFFNQFRGLQVIDISNSDAPVITGILELPASGEQMYVLANEHVVLLARDTCSYFGGDAESRVIVAKVTDGVPAVVSSIPVSGHILESRLVGTALYLAAQTYQRFEEVNDRTSDVENRWEWGTIVASHDLEVPAAPVAREEHWIPGSGHVIHATADYLFVSTQGVGSRWWQSRVEMIDITSPDGTLVPLSQIRPSGRVLDKFKMHVSGDVFTVISEVNTRSRVSRLETYDISDPARPTKLGSVDVGRNESLHATRFDGDKAYIVTFFRIDPLWVVDLSDPANPTLSGELEVPGWSTFIQPLGDRLLSIGIDDVEGFRVAVSLFDVRDPAKPGLLSRVPLGTNNSWSEANHDEKALGFVPEAGLVMIPFSSYDRNDNRTGVQLVELAEDELILRGTIVDDVTPRRATLHGDRILSLSGKSLKTVDASDYDNPRVLNDFPLSWAVDRVFAEQGYLIEVTHGNPWSDEAPVIRMAPQAAPYEILAELELAQPNIVGSMIRDGRLYVVQANGLGGPGQIFIDDAEVADDETAEKAVQPDNFRLSVYDVSALPAIPLLGSNQLHVEGADGVSNVTLHFPFDDVLTISMGQNYYYGGPIVVDIAFGLPYYGWSSGRRFVTFSVGQPEALRLLSNYPVETGDVWNFSKVFSSGTKLYMSHQRSRFLEEVLPPARTLASSVAPGVPEPEFADDAILPPGSLPEPVPDGTWIQQYFLNVIDFADPENPTEREPVNIPGTLVGLGRSGELLYTKAPHWDEETFETDWLEWLDASAYDGVSASLVDSIPLTFRWPHPTLVDRDVVYVGIPATNGRLREGEQRHEMNTLTAYHLADTGTFEMVSQVTLPFPAHELRMMDSLLLGRANQELWFYDVEQPGELITLGAGSQSNCFGFNLAAADGSAATGLWVPGGDYGVSHIALGMD